MEITSSFCGKREPHSEHTWQKLSTRSNYRCPGFGEVNTMHKLVAEVIATRRLVASIEEELRERPSGRGVLQRRASLRDQSIYLSGLERAATLALESSDLQILLDDLRGSHNEQAQ